MIRPATIDDIPLIRTRFLELHFPPYYPDDQGILDLLDSDVFLVDDVVGIISDWVREDALSTIRGRHVLEPPGMRLVDSITILRDSWIECANRWPDALDWRIEGDFEKYELPSGQDNNEVRCNAYRLALTRQGTGPRVDESRVDGELCIWWTLRQARDRAMQIAVPT